MLERITVLDGNPETGVHVPSDLDYLICVRYLFRAKVAFNLKRLRRKEKKTCFPSQTRTVIRVTIFHKYYGTDYETTMHN